MNIRAQKRGMLIGIICLMMLFLCGCMALQLPMEINTSLELDKSFKGKRVMSTIVADEVYEKVFQGDIKELQQMVTEKCPATLLCTANDMGDHVEIVMTLEFANYKDYVNKIGLILGKTPGIYYDATDSIFKNGFMLQEEFSSADLFGWLVDALKEKTTKLESKKLKDIFKSGTTVVKYDGRTYETENQIQVEDMESTSFKRISAEITLNKDESYKAELNYIVNQDVYYAMGESMDDAMKSILPDGGIYEVDSTDLERVYTIAFSALNEEALVSQLNVALHSTKCVFDVTSEGDAADPFRAHKEFVIYLDGSYFLDFTQNDTDMVYKLNVDSSYVIDGCDSTTGFLKSTSSETTGDFTSIYMTVSPSDEVRVNLTHAIEMHKLEAYTKIINETSYERRFKFVFSDRQAALVRENFQKRLEGRMDDEMSLKVTNSQGYTAYTVSFTGKNLDEISRKTSQFLDGTVSDDVSTFSSVLSGGKSDEKTLKTISYIYEDRLDFETFLGSASLNEGIIYHMEYPKGYTATLEEGAYRNIREENNEVQCTTKDTIIYVKSRGELANMAGMTQRILWWGSLILTVISFVINIRHIVGYIRKKEKYLLEVDLFKGLNIVFMTIGIVALVVFVFTTFRMIFRIF